MLQMIFIFTLLISKKPENKVGIYENSLEERSF